MPAVHNCSASLSLHLLEMSHFLTLSIATLLVDGMEVRLEAHLPGNHTGVAFSVFFIFMFLVLRKCLDGSFRLFHATALELYHNFSFAAQLYSIFMLLNDAALSTREWHFRAVSVIKGNLRQIKLLVVVVFFLFFGFVLFCFLGRAEEESSTRAAFCF